MLSFSLACCPCLFTIKLQMRLVFLSVSKVGRLPSPLPMKNPLKPLSQPSCVYGSVYGKGVHVIQPSNRNYLVKSPCHKDFAQDTTSNSAKVALLIVWSLNSNLFLINAFITEHNPDFKLLTETWLEAVTVRQFSLSQSLQTLTQWMFLEETGKVLVLLPYLKTTCGNFDSAEHLLCWKTDQKSCYKNVYRPARFSGSFYQQLLWAACCYYYRFQPCCHCLWFSHSHW